MLTAILITLALQGARAGAPCSRCSPSPTSNPSAATCPAPPRRSWLPLAGLILLRIATPIASVMLLWYLAIWFSGLPAFVIPRPERVLEVLWVDHAFIFEHLMATLQVAIR